jgi:hypothetical protein
MDNIKDPLLTPNVHNSVKLSQLAVITIPWIAIGFHTTLLPYIISPSQVEHYTGPNNKGHGFGIVTKWKKLLLTVS